MPTLSDFDRPRVLDYLQTHRSLSLSARLTQIFKNEHFTTSVPVDNIDSTHQRTQPTHIEGTPLARIFAILVGINRYESAKLQPNPSEFRPLRGAVPDVLEFKSFLKDDLKVPTDRIITLIDEDATRAKIIKALKSLRTNGRIESGDPILIYYAGHGTLVSPPADWECGGKDAQIQAIVPYDCDIQLQSGERIPPIHDRVFDVLLSWVAEEKGDNITVVFDCCHSASGTRAGAASGDEVRMVVLPPRQYPKGLDGDIWELESRNRSMHTPPRFERRGLRSHILFAACSPNQLARESNGHGRFSAAFLEVLRKVPPHELCYSEILKHPVFRDLPKDQTPQCEGFHLHRTLFNLNITIRRTPKAFVVSSKMTANDGHLQYVVDGGKMHNIRPDSEFDIYRVSDVDPAHKIGVLLVDRLGPISFFAKLSRDSVEFDLDHPTIAIQKYSGSREDLRIYAPQNDVFGQLDRIVKNSPSLEHDANSISIVRESINAHVQVMSVGKNRVELTMRTVSAQGNLAAYTHKFKHVVDVTDLRHIIPGLAHFYRELECGPDSVSNDPQLSSQIGIEFFELEETDEVTEAIPNEQLRPVDIDSNLYTNGVVDIMTVDARGECIPYGVKLSNRSTKELHMNVLYFNNNDLSISICVKPHASPDGRAPEVVLSSTGGSVAIGYGAAGWLPMFFDLPPELDVDVGFLKIYLSTDPVQMDHLTQDSPFSSTRGYRPYQSRNRSPFFWTSVVIPVVQRRRR